VVWTLRNKFPEIKALVVGEGQPVYLTKNGYVSMVVLSLEKYAELTDDIELKLTLTGDFSGVFMHGTNFQFIIYRNIIFFHEVTHLI
jgi:PHD/YefM family antitoxin component YafN of YafNO toxin-antitoxin module